MATNVDRKTSVVQTQIRSLDAQQITNIAVEFLKKLGNGKGIKPKKVSLQGQRYIAELDIGKRKTAKIQIDATTREIKEYEIETKPKETTTLPIEPKTLLIICGIVVGLYFLLTLLNVPALLGR
jgi:hypothetical protein